MSEQQQTTVTPSHGRAITADQESALRLRLTMLCMATVGGKEGDMRLCTEGILDYVSELIEPYSTTGRPQTPISSAHPRSEEP